MTGWVDGWVDGWHAMGGLDGMDGMRWMMSGKERREVVPCMHP
jgi:hypothetical protein